MKKLVLVMLLGAVTSVAQAQSGKLPPPVEAAIAESRETCAPEKVELEDGFIERKDVNGDGVKDFLLHYEAFVCGGQTGHFCGSAGCLMQVFASSGGSFRRVLDENVQDVNFRRVNGRPAMIIDLHGSACGRASAARCNKTLLWNGSRFSSAN